MVTDVWVAVIAFLGTCCGSIGGILASNKLVNFRLQSLEEKVNKHNNLIERMGIVEQRSISNEKRLENMEQERERS